MSADKRRGRGLSAEERDLWRGVTRSVAPLRARERRKAHPAPAEAADLPKAADPMPLGCAKPRPQPAHPRVAPKPAAPPLTPLGRRLKQRVARGTAEIDARIDLHGLTQSEAHSALLHFLRRAQADGGKIALVVTGKGRAVASDFANERGVLRRQVPLWLRLPEFRAYVVGFEPAGVRHGGEGALYLRLRRPRAE
jgi:DNA-nicking Smr family endonuclease